MAELPDVSRRAFLRAAGAGTAALAAGSWLAACSSSPSGPAGGPAGSPVGSVPAGSLPGTTALAGPTDAQLRQIDHVVVIMQENRSFDHYFGMRPGVRGFGDEPDAAVWRQPLPANPDGYVLPWHADTVAAKGQCLLDPDHSWGGQHAAWNGGAMDGFARTMGPVAITYYERADLPYYYALADAFTVCDASFCSVLGPTIPNRLYAMTGGIDAGGGAGGPATTNDGTYGWETYPERLERAGISWRVYHEEDDYDDNVLKMFRQFQGLPETSPLWDAALRNRPADAFMNDAAAGDLPQVSWIVSPTQPSEHPPFPVALGEDYTARHLAAIWANPALWAKTLVILTYDENGGFFDHVAPPVPEPGTPDEFVDGTPIGLGFRVPTTIISPWSTGGRVVSEVYDHTSTLQFLERRFGVEVPNLSDWRRETCGDLTACLDFSSADTALPSVPGLAETAARVDVANQSCLTGADLVLPSPQAMPVPEA